ncbi:MAG: hypothetical protein IPN33_00555 [Saprospiraceae bacterium]|nr:hypothetical protein [Saprospiraceae bacterium]
MRKLLNLLITFFVPALMMAPGTVSAQPGAKAEILTTEDGLSQGMVHFILQDRKKSGRFHRIQLGNNNTSGIANIGLTEVDALHFLVSTHDRLYLLMLPDNFFEKNALLDINQIEVPGNVVAGFSKDSLGNYCIRGNENSLYRLNIAKRKLTKADAGYLPKNFSKQACLFGCGNMQPDRSGIFWSGTMGYGLSKTNPNSSRFRHLGPGHSILSMAAKNDNSILATTFRYRFFQFDAPPGSGSANELFHSNIRGSYGVKLAPTRSGGFWASHVTIFYHFPPFANPEIFPSEALLQSAEKANSTNQKLTIENFRIESIVFESRGGNVFCGRQWRFVVLRAQNGQGSRVRLQRPQRKVSFHDNAHRHIRGLERRLLDGDTVRLCTGTTHSGRPLGVRLVSQQRR